MASACLLPCREFEVEVCSLGLPGPVAEELLAAGIPCRTLGRRWSVDPIAQGRLLRHLRKAKPQVVHAWDRDAAIYAANALRWASGPRFVVQQHFARPSQTAWQSLIDRQVARSADLRIASSDSIRQDPALGSLADDRWEILPPGVNEPPNSAGTREELLEELSLPPDAKLIGVAGPLMPRYGLKELIWAADMVRVLHPRVRLLIVGEGPERPHLERFARTAADPENICFLGDRNDLAKILPHLDVYWQGNGPCAESPALLQAMAAGVPVVATDTPVHREKIVDRESGYLVEADARAHRTRLTDALFGDPGLREKISSAGREQVRRHFPIDRHLERLAEIYRELLRQGVQRRGGSRPYADRSTGGRMATADDK